MFKYTLAAAIAVASFSGAAVASNNVAVGVVGGTAGFGAELTYAITDHFNVRGTYRGYTYNKDFNEGNLRYKGELKLKNGGVLLDWFPLDGGFRLSVGAMHNGNELTGKSKQTATGQYKIGDTTYSVDGRVKAKADWRSFAPYLGLGWGNAVANKSKLSVTADLGIMYTGKPSVKLKTTDSTLNANSAFMQDLKREEKKLAKDIKDVKYYPVAQIGLSYSF